MKMKTNSNNWWKAHLVERDTEAIYQSLVNNNENRISRGLPPFTPSYELAEKIAQNNLKGIPD